MNLPRRQSGFTLIELLVVISILGILAALSVPALKSLGKSNISVSASRQMLDDIGHARQMAIGQHTTVYMIFVKTNFWMAPLFPTPNLWWFKLTAAQRTAATNVCDKQLTGYAFVTLRSVGDQPGQGSARYLSSWRNLPEGTFIASQKFVAPATLISSQTQPLFANWNQDYPHADQNRVYGFSTTNTIPFPTEDSPPASGQNIPYIAFNYLGQLTFDGQSQADRDEYIPLAQGSVGTPIDLTTKAFLLLPLPGGAASLSETPAGNSTNSTYNIVHIDHLTGRATMEYHRVQ